MSFEVFTLEGCRKAPKVKSKDMKNNRCARLTFDTILHHL